MSTYGKTFDIKQLFEIFLLVIQANLDVLKMVKCWWNLGVSRGQNETFHNNKNGGGIPHFSKLLSKYKANFLYSFSANWNVHYARLPALAILLCKSYTKGSILLYTDAALVLLALPWKDCSCSFKHLKQALQWWDWWWFTSENKIKRVFNNLSCREPFKKSFA